MATKDDINDEIEHWIKFINIWQKENSSPVPPIALLSLEFAVEKALNIHWKEQTSVKTQH